MDNIAMPDMLPPVVLDATAVPDGDRDPLSAVGIGQLPPEIRFMIWELATDVGPGQVLEIREVECGGTYGEGETPYSIHRFVGKRIPPITALICSESRAIGCPSGMFVSFENPPHGSDEGSFTPNEDSAQRIQDVDRRWAWFDASRDMIYFSSLCSRYHMNKFGQIMSVAQHVALPCCFHDTLLQILNPIFSPRLQKITEVAVGLDCIHPNKGSMGGRIVDGEHIVMLNLDADDYVDFDQEAYEPEFPANSKLRKTVIELNLNLDDDAVFEIGQFATNILFHALESGLRPGKFAEFPEMIERHEHFDAGSVLKQASLMRLKRLRDKSAYCLACVVIQGRPEVPRGESTDEGWSWTGKYYTTWSNTDWSWWLRDS